MTADLTPVARVFDQVAEDYETVGPSFFDHFGGLLVAHAGVRPGDRVLDLAAGSGSVSLSALGAAGPTGGLLAVDIAPSMVRRLSARLAATGHPDARVVVGDAAALGPDVEQLLDRPVDAVLCGFALFFLADPAAALHSWTGHLRPGGRLAVSTWGAEDRLFGALRDALQELGVQSRGRGEAYDDPAVLRAALLDSGLTGVEVRSEVLDLHLSGVDELLRWARTHGGRAWLDQLDAAGASRLRTTLLERWPGAIVMHWQAHLAVGTRPAARRS